jgi:hypothetical protein
MAAFVGAGVRQLGIDPLGPYAGRELHRERFAREVRPLLGPTAG